MPFPSAPSAPSSAPLRRELVPTARKLDVLWDRQDFKGVIQAVSGVVASLQTDRRTRLTPKQVVARTEELYLLQHALLGAVNRLTWKHDRAAKKQGLQLLKQVGALQTATFQRAQRMSNSHQGAKAVLPLELYGNTYKLPNIPSREQVRTIYRQELEEFLGAGGKLSDVHPLDKSFLKTVQPGRLLEFAVDRFDEANVAYADTEVTPGHSLLSHGEDVLAAGSFKVFKDARGNIQQVVIGGFSGHFRPPSHTLQHLARHLLALGVPAERIILSEGEATTFRSTEILQALTGERGARAQAKADALIAQAEKWSGKTPAPSKTSDAFDEAHVSLSLAREALDATVAMALRDTVVVPAEAQTLVDGFDRALTAARNANDARAFADVLETLNHVAGLQAPYAAPPVQQTLRSTLQRWQQDGFVPANPRT